MNKIALVAGLPLGVLATGGFAVTAEAAPKKTTTTQTFNYDLNTQPTPQPSGTPVSGYDVNIGSSISSQYYYNFGPVFDGTNEPGLAPKLYGNADAFVNPEIFSSATTPTANENYQPKAQTGPSVTTIDTKDPVQTLLSDTSGVQAVSDSFMHLKFDIDGQTQLGTARFSSDGQTLYDITYFAAAVPEPALWAELILGFGAIGGALRSRRRRRDQALPLAA